MGGEVTASPLPEGYAGALLVELEEERSHEEETARFILARARSLAWQAVRHTPCDLACAGICVSWLRHARIWAARRHMEALSAELAEVLERLEASLPKLASHKYQ